MLGRVLAYSLSGFSGQQVIVENRSGAGGIVGAQAVATAAPDGYTLLIGSTSNISITPGLYSRLPYDSNRAFAPVAIIVDSPQVLVASSRGPSSVQDLLTRARAGQLRFSSSGMGSISHLAGELFKARAGINLVHVPFNGAASALVAVIRDDVQLTLADPASVMPQIKSGQLRALAVSSQQRVPQLSDVPTLAESGVSGAEASNWIGIFAPAGTASGVISRLYQLVGQMVSTPDVANRLAQAGMLARILPPNDTQTFVQSETDKWGQVARAANIHAD
jgi:tripartite-type tricarboxylate transporter receptor subunit TctC